MAATSTASYVIRIGAVVLSIAMVWFMLERPNLYPLWTVVLIALVGAVSAFSVLRLYRDR